MDDETSTTDGQPADQPDREWFATGDLQHIPGGRADRLEAALEYATKSGTHLWIATAVHILGDTALDQLDATDETALLLDAESLAMAPLFGCYVCEQSYEPRLRLRRCKGEPKRTTRLAWRLPS